MEGEGGLIVAPKQAKPAAIVVHLHGMGDGVWDAFKDGIQVFPDEFDAALYLPDIGSQPWCSLESLASLSAFLGELRSENPSIPLILTGTSMGGTMALASLSDPELQGIISGVIAFSATSRLDILLKSTNSPEIQKALLASVAGDVEVLKDCSLDYAEIKADIPIVLGYSECDPIVPPKSLLRTAETLRSKQVRIELMKMRRPPGHYRPVKPELRDAFVWVCQNLPRPSCDG